MSLTYVIYPSSNISLVQGTWSNYHAAAWDQRTSADLLRGFNSTANSAPDYSTGCGKLSLSDPSPVGTDQIVRAQFALNSNNISLNGGPLINFTGLPAGFTPLTATISANVNGIVSGGSIVRFQADKFTEGAVSVPGSFTLQSFALPTVPSILNLISNGWGIRATLTGSSDFVAFDDFSISGTYAIVTNTWYYNPNTNHYQYSSTNPGAPWIPQTPTPTITSISPNQGPTVFPPPWDSGFIQETISVSGSGIGDGAIVTLDGVPVLNPTVNNQTSFSGVVQGFSGTLSGPSLVTIDGEDPTHTGQEVLATTSLGNTVLYNPDGTSATLPSSWTYYQAQQTWWQTVALPFLFFSYLSPSLTFPYGFFFNSVFYPANTQFIWTNTTAPSKPGWWMSLNDYQGAAFVIAQSTPHNPRTFDELTNFATGSAGMQGGFPGPSCVWNNRLVYAEGGYTVGTNQPPIDIYDGAFNHTVALVPTTSTGGIPKAVMSMLAANGTVYFSTFDSGTSNANYVGRVFSLSINTGQMVQLGATTDFATGDVPYSLAFFLGKLWVGTNRADGSASHIYWIRPGIDTNWTQDLALSTKSQGGATSMAVFQGNLYVGCSNQAGTFAQVLARDTSGNWTTSDTASGGTATANNAYLAMTVFGSNLYATYWNNDSPVKSLIRQFNGSSWSTVYTGSGDTLVPFVALPTDQTNLLALGGGLTYSGAIVTSTNGTSWTDSSVFLTGNATNTGVPVFGVVIH